MPYSVTMLTIAADPKHLGARIGITAVLHTWGSALTHHPHVDMIVPGGGIALDGTRWISSRPAFLLPVRVLGALFRRLFLTRLLALFDAGKLAFFNTSAGLATRKAFLWHLSPIRKKRWVVYAKPPFAGPQAVLAYLSRYTHRVRETGSAAPGQMGGHKRGILSGPSREWLLERAGKDFTLRGLVAELAERGVKVDYVQVWRFVHAEGLSFKKSVLPTEQLRPAIARRREQWNKYQGRLIRLGSSSSTRVER